MGDQKFITDGMVLLGDKFGAFYEKNKAHIFTGLGIGGTIATGVMSAKSGAKTARKIDRRSGELGRPLTGKEKIQLCWKDFIGPVAVGGLACFSEFKSDQINTKTIADRTALLIASEKAYEKLSKKTKEVLGEKKANQVRDEIAKENAMQNITHEKLDSAPRVGQGTLYPFMDGYSKLVFWSNLDYINLWVMKLQQMMSDLKPRGGDDDYYDKMIGVPYREWLAAMGFPKQVYDTPERKNKGWNKGFARNGEDDDPITFYRTTVEYEPGFAVTVINWDVDPTDMKLGRLIKSSGVSV